MSQAGFTYGIANAGSVAVVDVLGIPTHSDASERIIGLGRGTVDGEAGAHVRDESEEGGVDGVGPWWVDAFVIGVFGSSAEKRAEERAAVKAGPLDGGGFDNVVFARVPERRLDELGQGVGLLGVEGRSARIAEEIRYDGSFS